jgi:hypothetical protein
MKQNDVLSAMQVVVLDHYTHIQPEYQLSDWATMAVRIRHKTYL